jgi:hypothetical protein
LFGYALPMRGALPLIIIMLTIWFSLRRNPRRPKHALRQSNGNGCSDAED